MIIVCLTQGEMCTDVFILEPCVDGCSLSVEEMGEVRFDSCSMALIDGYFVGGRGRNGKNSDFADRILGFMKSITVVKCRLVDLIDVI